MSSVTILHNRRAGQPSFAAQVENVADELARHGVAVRLERRDEIDGLLLAARESVAAQADAVLVAGGDGTVGAIAGELAGSPVALGVLPAGTANVLAKTLQIPRPGLGRRDTLRRAAWLLLDSPARLTDLGCANDQTFIMWAGMGLDALVTTAFEQQRARQRTAFAFNVALTFWAARHWRGLDLTLRASGPAGSSEARGHFMMATVGQTGWHGGGLFRFSDDFHLDDGLMDLWAFEGASYSEGLALAARVFVGRHNGHPKVHRLTGDQFEFEAVEPQGIQVDAEPRPPVRRLSVRVLPRRLRLLAPPAAAGLYLDHRS